jgi:hypothetical protein
MFENFDESGKKAGGQLSGLDEEELGSNRGLFVVNGYKDIQQEFEYKIMYQNALNQGNKVTSDSPELSDECIIQNIEGSLIVWKPEKGSIEVIKGWQQLINQKYLRK